MHCVQVRSLPVSATPKNSQGGAPTDIFMRYSPMSDIIVDLGMFERNEILLKKSTRLMERCKAFLTRCDSVYEGL